MRITNLFKTMSLALMMCATTQMQAADVNLATAQNAAKAFMNRQVATGRLKAAAATNLQLVKAEASVARPTAVDYYIFNSDRSYVVIAGDDLAPEVLMYGEEGKLDMNNIPPAMQWLLNKYKYQIDGIKAGTLAPVKAPKYATTPVAPLVTANWDQTAPYYNQCPTSGSRRTLTGCPATSMSMNYYKWKWPETYPACVAIASSNYGVAAAALPERAADWDNIIDEYTGPTNTSYTTAQANAVAWLMRYAGQSMVDYMYGTSASGANDPDILVGAHNMGYTDAQLLTLTTYNGYSNGSQNYTDAQWNEWMMNELQNGRPIEYLAYDSKNSDHGGHAFNVFGCNASGQYYVNWGWSGSSNGYCTLHNFTTANGSTSGSSGSYIFNWGEAMIIGIEPPAGALTNPRITVNPTTLDMSAVVGTPTTATFTVTGANLTGNVNLSVTGDNAFSLSTSSISASQAENGVTVTVTYNPSAAGTHEATVTLSSTDADNVTVKLNGSSTIRKENIVLQEAANVANTSFKAIWTDETPAANVASYTLWVNNDNTPEVKLLNEIDWTTSANVPDGWTSSNLKYYSNNSACYLTSSGYVQSNNYDLKDYDKVTVKIYAEPYQTGNTLTVATSTDTKTISSMTSGSFNWYTFVLDCADSDYIKITSSGMPDMRQVEVYAGDASQQTKAPARTVAEEGDATYRIITGITDKSYTVDGLTPEATYYFKVKALYVDGSESSWSETKEVTLLTNTNPTITVSARNVEFNATYTGQSSEKSITVTGTNLTGGITAVLTDENGVFAINTTSITAAEAAQGKAINITFTPEVAQNYTGSIKLTSNGADEVIVNLSGNGELRKVVPVMQPVDTNYVHLTSFRADWTDETPSDNVASYTLWVNFLQAVTEPVLLEDANFTSLTAVTNTSNQLTNVASSASDYLPTGWTAQTGLWINSGFIISGNVSNYTCGITSPTYDFTGYNKATIVMSAYSYYSSYYGEATIRVRTSAGSQEVTLATDDFTTYTVVLDVAESDQVVFEGVANMFAIEDIKIYAGDNTDTANAPLRIVAEQGDSTTRTITGITDKFYTVKDLTAGGTFDYKVKAVYTDGTESDWSNIAQVTLFDRPETALLGDVNLDGVVDVTDINILVNIVLGKGNTTQALRKNANRHLMIEGFNK